MKIGILTYHAVCNFGANLQAISTLYYLINKGYDPIFINWMTKELEERYKKETPFEQFREHKKFREKYFPMTRRCYSDDDIVSVIREERIEAVIVGSDAVMQTHPIRSRLIIPSRRIVSIFKPGKDINPPNPFWGSFFSLLRNKIPLIYMSASSQNSPYRYSNKVEKELQKKLLLQYDYISTRDDWTAKMVTWLTDGKIKPMVTPDPVFAFNHNFFNLPTESFIRNKFGLNKEYCLVSFHKNSVSNKWLKKLQEKMNNKNIQCVAFPFPKGIGFNHPFEKQINIPLSPIDWYALIKYSNCYIGDNMHPIVVCLHNAVPCFSFDHYGIAYFFRCFVNKKSSKIYHILNRFGHSCNRASLLGLHKTPTVEHVIKMIESFDKELVQKHSKDYYSEYLCMMKRIESIINFKSINNS